MLNAVSNSSKFTFKTNNNLLLINDEFFHEIVSTTNSFLNGQNDMHLNKNVSKDPIIHPSIQSETDVKRAV